MSPQRFACFAEARQKSLHSIAFPDDKLHFSGVFRVPSLSGGPFAVTGLKVSARLFHRFLGKNGFPLAVFTRFRHDSGSLKQGVWTALFGVW